MELPGAEDKELIQPQEPKVKQRHLEDAKKQIEIPQRLGDFPNLEKIDEIHVNF